MSLKDTLKDDQTLRCKQDSCIKVELKPGINGNDGARWKKRIEFTDNRSDAGGNG
jgi:hypothetical protein